MSVAPYTSLNLGQHVGDDPKAVAQNRVLLGQALAVRPVFLQQVHGTEVAWLDRDAADGQVADASATVQRSLACTILMADCLPVLMTTLSGEVVAAAHAGWRGLAAGVLEATLQQMWRQVGAKSGTPDAMAAQTLVWLGPCIGPQAFEVGAEVRAAFVVQQPQAQECFTPQGADKFLGDLPGLARQRLQALGVARIYGNDGSAAWCTVSQPERFFSHRRDRVSGRMAACIWRE
jgi:YfiH family protein